MEITNQEFDFSIFETEKSKYNTSIKLSKADRNNGVKIYCREDYAQEVYDKLMNDDSNPNFGPKDLKVGQIYKVVAKTIYFNSETIIVEELNSKTPIAVPFKEYSKTLDSLQKGEGLEFFALIYKSSADGEYLGSEKKCLGVSYKQELFDHLSNNTWFDVKIMKLIKGGYLAMYNGTVECFIPGSHAAANIIHNFSEMLGRTITVMVDNYDRANDLFILSYKKYITHSMSVMVTELRFDKLYTGRLTNKPYDFGVFVEFENYYTGLIHKSEFENYDEIMRTMRTGDDMSFYVKDVTTKGSQYRIVLTLNQDQVNSEKLGWEKLRGSAENQSFEYSIDTNKNSIKININDQDYEVSLKKKDLDSNLSQFPRVKVSKVDPINRQLNFEFTGE